MLFNELLKDETEKLFNDRMVLLGNEGLKIKSEIVSMGLNEDEKLCLWYVLGNLPISDCADYPLELFKNTVVHSLSLREKYQYCKNVPFELFLDYVLCPRVNNEALSEHRGLFFDVFFDEEFEKETPYNKVINVNYKCLKYVTYQSTDDRTSSALAIFNRGYGRCGEESVFTVSVLRSLGIPARQVYAPYWAHCDDNHAWAEAWVDGKWHYLGACEPEMTLDRGWFTAAASRAVMIHTRLFGTDTHGEKLISRDGTASMINLTDRYAVTEEVNIKVLKSGEPLSGVNVILSLINYGRISPFAQLQTDDNGEIHIQLGLGSILIQADYESIYTEKLVEVEKEKTVVIDFDKKETLGNSFDFSAPEDGKKYAPPIEKDKMLIHKKLFEENSRFRTERNNSFAKVWGEKEKQTELKEMLERAKSNGEVVFRFLMNNPDEIYREILGCLNQKDYTDIDMDILKAHAEHGKQYGHIYDNHIFAPYVLSPRVDFEPITDYREFICDYFKDTKEKMTDNPLLIWEYIENNIRCIEQEDYSQIYTSPVGCLKTGMGNEKSRNILFVAICRSFGIPARLNPVYKTPEYWKNGGFESVEKNKESAGIVLSGQEDISWVYGTNWSIALFDNHEYRVLEFPQETVPEDLNGVSLKEGDYRIITANRLPNGSIYCNKYDMNLSPGDKIEKNVLLRAFELNDMLIDIQINDFNVTEVKGQRVFFRDTMKCRWNLVLWLAAAEEPTEHIFNELLENKELFMKLDCGITYILRSEEELNNSTLQKTLESLPFINVVYDYGFEHHEMTARNLYVDPGTLPLAAVVSKDLKAVYAFSGYRVGLGELLYKVLKYKGDKE